MSDVSVEITGLKKSFGSLDVLKGIDATINRGDVVCIIGPSGSGKSTLLRCVNLLEEPNDGKIVVNGVELTDPDVDIDKARTKIGMVFQSFNLFAHLNVLNNLMVAQRKVLKRSEKEAQEVALRNLDRVGLREKAHAMPAQLSGGQQQRVAIARALSMDPELVGDVLGVMRQLADEGMTMLVVTHEMQFAREVADKVIFMDGGYIVEEGPAADVVGNPQEPRTQEFLARVLDPTHHGPSDPV
jgi:polar amino acid transport system ATP-binding protein